MARVNTRDERAPRTHGGVIAPRIDAEAQLRRSVMSCLLWENEAYEDGKSIAERIAEAARNVTPEVLANVAIEARHVMHLRHAPLWLLVQLCKTGTGKRKLVVDTIERVISRADEPGELLALYQKANGGENAPLSNPLRLGLAKAFLKFGAYHLSKYAKTGDIRLRDVMFLVHPNPRSLDGGLLGGPSAELYRKLAEDELSADDAGTWEAELSAGADKKETFERLIRENKLGYMALLRNLRNMVEARCDGALIENAIIARRGADRVLPFRFITAARHAPDFAFALDTALLATVEQMRPLRGKTIVLVDVSGSMGRKISGKSELSRFDAAAALASVIKGDEVEVYSFSNKTVRVSDPRGLQGIEAIRRSQAHSSTALAAAVAEMNQKGYDRLIVITDEQATDGRVPGPRGLGYMINVASARNGVGYGPWVRVDGWSDNILRYIGMAEAAMERAEVVAA